MVKQVMPREKEKERRAWPIRFDMQTTTDEVRSIEGYAAVFGSLSLDLGGWREQIEQGAFRRSILENDVRALWDHDSKYVLGRNKAGTLALVEDDHGLRVSISPPDTVWATDLVQSMRRGDVSQMSFGFYVRDDEWNQTPEGLVRTLKDVDLFDVSIVSYPAYVETSAEARQRATSFEVIQPGTADDDEAVTIARARGAARARDIEILGFEV